MTEIILKTRVKPSLIKQALFTGSAIASLGISLLLFTGTWLTLPTLETYGLWIFTVCLALIILGVLPYKRLQKLSLTPEQLRVSDHSIRVYSKNTPLLSIPFSAIESLHYAHYRTQYGIALYLKKKPPTKLCITHPHFDLTSLQKKSLRQWGCSLFFPYHSEKSHLKLLEIIEKK